MRLYIARHGETAFNDLDLLQGQQNITLNQKGLLQARALAIALRGENLDVIYSSDLRRGRQTSDIIAKASGLKAIPAKEARERCFGVFEGTGRTAFLCPGAGALRPLFAPARRGESFADLFARSASFLGLLFKRHSHERVLLVSHGDFARMSLGVLLGKTVPEACLIPQKNCCINILEVDNRLSGRIIALNRVGHLSPGLVSQNRSEL